MTRTDEGADIDVGNSVSPSRNHLFKTRNINKSSINCIFSKFLNRDFSIEQSGGAVEDHAGEAYAAFRTGIPRNSWVRAFQPGLPINFGKRICFRYKGSVPQDTSILSRIGIGMEGPNDDTNLWAKVGLEGYGEDRVGSCYGLIVSDGLCRTTLSTMLPINKRK